MNLFEKLKPIIFVKIGGIRVFFLILMSTADFLVKIDTLIS